MAPLPLSKVRINDNWANKPIGSLSAIFIAQTPQTAASLDERKRALNMLVQRVPDIGWQICIDQFGQGGGIAGLSYRPHWRSDASGAGQPVTNGEVYEFACHALDLAIAWEHHNDETLGDLVERLQAIPEEGQAAVWDLIDDWAGRAAAGDDPKARDCANQQPRGSERARPTDTRARLRAAPQPGAREATSDSPRRPR